MLPLELALPRAHALISARLPPGLERLVEKIFIFLIVARRRLPQHPRRV